MSPLETPGQTGWPSEVVDLVTGRDTVRDTCDPLSSTDKVRP